MERLKPEGNLRGINCVERRTPKSYEAGRTDMYRKIVAFSSVLSYSAMDIAPVSPPDFRD